MGASLPGLAMGQKLQTSIRPVLRGNRRFSSGGTPVSDIFARSGLGARTGFVVSDLSSGRILESHQPQLMQPPASVAKVFTSLYALHHLGGGFRFQTRLLATGPVQQGRIQGDLYLAGAGDPLLDTDGLADLAAQLKARGIFGITGNFYVVSSALPYLREIDPGQPDHVGYNPAISGLNLNFNRVHFQWKRTENGYSVAMTARTNKYAPPVGSVAMSVVNRQSPVFGYRSIEGRDHWTVAASALGRNGSRWLPVRTPATYAGEVFRWIAAQQGVRLPLHREARAAKGTVVAGEQSAALQPMLRGLLRYSTNLTAEVAGLRASAARGASARDLSASGDAMTSWIRQRYGLSRARFVNHSGLSDKSRMTAAEMVQALDIAAQSGPLPTLLKDIPLVNRQGKKAPIPGVSVVAKTGTLNFTRALAGYISGSGGKLAFAIFAADLDARSGISRSQQEAPRGAGSWTGRAKRQEQELLRRWATRHL